MHQQFSLKRVEALEAKQQRLHWLKAHMPSMVEEAKADIIMTCIYVMQGSLKHFPPEELKQAKNMMYAAMADVVPVKWNGSCSMLRNLLLQSAQRNLELTARILNLLIAIHVLN